MARSSRSAKSINTGVVDNMWASFAPCRNRVVVLLLSWPFSLSLVLLIANDLYLKYAYPGWLSGKLSDVSGIFLLVYFLFGMFPKVKWLSTVLVVLSFVFWKSPFSQSLIETINIVTAVNIGRVVDYSDFLAFAVIPFAWIIELRNSYSKFPNFPRRIAALPVALISVAALTGTSVLMPFGEYSIRNSDLEHRVDESAIIAAIARVADRYELECEYCEAKLNEAYYFNEDMDFWFKIDEATNGIQYRIRVTKMKGFLLPNPDYDLFERFQRDLKREMGDLSPNMELVESLSGPPYSY